MTTNLTTTKQTSTLTSSGWRDYTQTLQIEGITEDTYVIAVPKSESKTDYVKAGIHYTTQSDGTLMFECGKAPSKNIDVVVTVWDGYEVGTEDEELSPSLGILDETSWATISTIAQAGTGSNYWSVGDCKAVDLIGNVGDGLTLNTTLYVYILGFNHNGSTGIDFGGFKSALTGGTDVALCDSGYNSEKTSDTWFNMNNSTSNANGWKKCRMRYYVLGSTDSSSGADASNTTATSPVSNTLMAALPSALRAVMRPMTIYSDNTGGGSGTASYVTATVDYLPLLAEYEVFGTRTNANSAEKNYQAQYQYYINGNSKVKYKHNAISTSCDWWLRSIDVNYSTTFCYVYVSGNVNFYNANYSFGVAPAFRV